MLRHSAFYLAVLVCLPGVLSAQPDRLTGAIQGGRRVTLAGHIHPMARPDFDRGRIDPSFVMRSVMLVLKPTAAQEAELDKLLAEQQDPSSPSYLRWISPEEYADRFGVSQDDVNKLVAWLEQQNLKVTSIARARNSVRVEGKAADVEKAFGTEIHRYQEDGEVHFANATPPSVPAPLDVVVKAIRGLNDFRMSPRRIGGKPLRPDYTSVSGRHYLAPNDLATIYDITALYNVGIDGTGQKLVVVGQTQVDLSDIQKFRTRFSLPANDPQVVLVPNLPDPGTRSDDQVEADLDLEWAGAVARNATIIYVYSDDVTDAVHYAIDQNLAPVLSMSYGICEPFDSAVDAASLQFWAKQGNAQGITWFNSSGDAGGADCANGSSATAAGPSVDLPASIPEITGVGGTEFNEDAPGYWDAVTDSSGASALSYIPEIVWNDSAIEGNPAAGGGGASMYFLKPVWQAGPGVPNDGARDVPDVALASSAQHDGYLFYNEGSLGVVGGTSAAAPALAGIATLLNHRLVLGGIQSKPGLGNINPKLYNMAQTSPWVFHDIVAGNNIVTISCTVRARNCVEGSYGYVAGPGYDQASGLGSVDVYNFVLAWAGPGGAVSRGSASLVLTSSAGSISSDGSLILTANVTGTNGQTPLGSVTFLLGSAMLGTATLSGSGGSATAKLTVSGAQLPLGSGTITAQYSGDISFNSATASITISVVSAAAAGAPSIAALANSASFRTVYAPGMILSVFGDHLAPSTWIAQSVPLPMQMAGVSVTINGIRAPLYYVSPDLLNIQVPNEITVGAASLIVNNNGQTASATFNVASAAPGIFADQTVALVPAKTAARNQIIALYMTGMGAVSPAVPTGSAPASGTPLSNLPQPVQATTVTVGGMPAPVQFIGIPWGLVGVLQINFQVPATVPLGTQQVVVKVDGVSSPPVSLTVTN